MWETEASIGRERTLLILTCKKWHVAKRLAERIRQVTGMAAVDYLFDEAATPLPELGGIGSSLDKRTRHRRALMRLIWHRDARLRHAIRWYYRMGRRVWFHEIISFFLRDRYGRSGLSLRAFWGEPQDHEEEASAVRPRSADAA